VIGNNVTLKNGVSVWDRVTLEDGVFVGPNATFTNDRRPRSGNPNWQVQKTVIGRGASIGANATILCGIRIGAFAMIGAGAVVTADVPTMPSAMEIPHDSTAGCAPVQRDWPLPVLPRCAASVASNIGRRLAG
jgi:acetyltransferase-like isoleucine patch superfamily enzyme